MAPDEKSAWTPPKGYVLTVLPGHTLNAKGYEATGAARPVDVMPDGAIEVAHFIESEPFIWTENDGKGPNASVEAREAALAGEPLAGWSPNCINLPIKDGWVPPQYHLVHEDDESHGAVEPASVLTPPEASS